MGVFGLSSEISDKSAQVYPFFFARLIISENNIKLTPLPSLQAAPIRFL